MMVHNRSDINLIGKITNTLNGKIKQYNVLVGQHILIHAYECDYCDSWRVTRRLHARRVMCVPVACCPWRRAAWWRRGTWSRVPGAWCRWSGCPSCRLQHTHSSHWPAHDALICEWMKRFHFLPLTSSPPRNLFQPLNRILSPKSDINRSHFSSPFSESYFNLWMNFSYKSV